MTFSRKRGLLSSESYGPAHLTRCVIQLNDMIELSLAEPAAIKARYQRICVNASVGGDYFPILSSVFDNFQ
jgi:hypothetical protein